MSTKQLQHTAEEIDAQITATQEHCPCKTNPHNVTAEQTGAYTLADGLRLALALGETRKNILRNTSSSKTTNGITYNVAADGSFTARGTATADAFLTIRSSVAVPVSARYILSGCPAGGSASKYQLYLSGDFSAYDRGSGATVWLDAGGAVSAYFMVKSGQTVDFTVHPMLRPEAITDATFEAYKPSISERLAALEVQFPTSAMIAEE